MNKRSPIKHAFLLAAGFGTRMEKYTEHVPKPMLPVGNVPLIVYSLYTLKKMGIENVTVNTHYKSEIIENFLQKAPFDVQISKEKNILGTAGGIKNAIFHNKIPNEGSFVLLNTDLILEPPLSTETEFPTSLPSNVWSRLYLKEKKSDNAETGWNLDSNSRLTHAADGRYYYIGFSILNPELLTLVPEVKTAHLGDLWKQTARQNRLQGCYYRPKVTSCGDLAEYEKVKNEVPGFVQSDPEFHAFCRSFSL